MTLALDDLPRGPDRPLYDLPPMTEVITWQKASLVSAQGKHDTFRKYLDATHAAIGKLRLMIRWLPPRQFGRRLERLTSYQFHLGLENLKQAAAVAGMAQEAASGSCGTPHPIHAVAATQLERFAGAPAADRGAGRSSPLRGRGELGGGETQWIEPMDFESMVSGGVTAYEIRRLPPWA